jgi:hypothetical protein
MSSQQADLNFEPLPKPANQIRNPTLIRRSRGYYRYRQGQKLTHTHGHAMRLNFRRLGLVFCVLVALPVRAKAATFEATSAKPFVEDGRPEGIYYTLRGPIEAGDSIRIRDEIVEHPDRILWRQSIKLDSRGGDFVEATRIASLFQDLGAMIDVEAGAECNGPCALIYMTAPMRLAFEGNVILLRPPSGAKGNIDTFLRKSEVPVQLIEAVENADPYSGYRLAAIELVELGILSPPMLELALKACRPKTPKTPDELMECANRASANMLIATLDKLVGKTKLARATRNVEAASVRYDKSSPLTGDIRGAIEFHRRTYLMDPVSPLLQVISNLGFKSWRERAVGHGLAVQDPVDPRFRTRYLTNVLLPALARTDDVSAMMQMGALGVLFNDPDSAFPWFLKAAEHGDRRAPWHLAVSYEFGAGVKADPLRAYAWAILAKPEMPVESQRVLDRLRSRLSRAQMAEAATLAKELVSGAPESRP